MTDCAREDKMAEFKRCELTDLAKTCILHSLSVLKGEDESSSIEHINKFCKALYHAVRHQKIKHSSKSLDVDPQSVIKFSTGEICSEDFLTEIERAINKSAVDNFDHESYFKVCWEAYHQQKMPERIVVEFSSRPLRESMYHLWLVFNAIIPPKSSKMMMPAKNLDVIMKRVYDMCRHKSTRDELGYDTTTSNSDLDFPEVLEVIARYQAKFDLNQGLTIEVSLQSTAYAYITMYIHVGSSRLERGGSGRHS